MIQERRTKYTFANRPCLRLLRLQPGQIRLTPLDHSGLTFPSPLSAMVGSGPCDPGSPPARRKSRAGLGFPGSHGPSNRFYQTKVNAELTGGGLKSRHVRAAPGLTSLWNDAVKPLRFRWCASKKISALDLSYASTFNCGR